MTAGPPLSKFKPEKIKAILADIEKHIPYKYACESNGIAESTFYFWLQKGVKYAADNIEDEHTKLLESVRTVEKKRMAKHLDKVEKSNKGSHGAQWLLERVFWKHFGGNAAAMEMNKRLELLEMQKGDSSEEGSKALDQKRD